VIDLVADDVPDLLRQLDGRELRTAAATVRLQTRTAPLVAFDADWRTRLLAVITEPSLALILMMVGIYGLLFEFSNPGLRAARRGRRDLPAARAVRAADAAGQLRRSGADPARHRLPVAEAYLPSFGTLGIGGLPRSRSAQLLLIDSDVPGFGIPLALIGLLSLVSAAFILLVAGMAAKARARPVVSGAPRCVGAPASWSNSSGRRGWADAAGRALEVRGAGPAPRRPVRVTRSWAAPLQVARTRCVRAPGAYIMIFVTSVRCILLLCCCSVSLRSLRILREYERGVVFQLGRFWKVKGPGS
jgi:membrane-bound serine protease (ClpP class)